MVEKPKNKTLRQLFFEYLRTDFIGGLLGFVIMFFAVAFIAQAMRSEEDSFVDPTVIRDTMVAGDCAITILYNPQKADQAVFAIDCTTEHYGQYFLQLQGSAMRDYGEIATAIHGNVGQGTYLHETGTTNVPPDTTLILFRFEPQDGEELFVSIRIR